MEEAKTNSKTTHFRIEGVPLISLAFGQPASPRGSLKNKGEDFRVNCFEPTQM